MKKILIPLYDNDVAPRFDLATEVVIVVLGEDGTPWEERLVVLPQASAEQLCQLILTEGVGAVICGGVEEEYYQYLTWKRVKVLDSVIGLWKPTLDRFLAGDLSAGDIVSDPGGVTGNA